MSYVDPRIAQIVREQLNLTSRGGYRGGRGYRGFRGRGRGFQPRNNVFIIQEPGTSGQQKPGCTTDNVKNSGGKKKEKKQAATKNIQDVQQHEHLESMAGMLKHNGGYFVFHPTVSGKKTDNTPTTFGPSSPFVIWKRKNSSNIPTAEECIVSLYMAISCYSMDLGYSGANQVMALHSGKWIDQMCGRVGTENIVKLFSNMAADAISCNGMLEAFYGNIKTRHAASSDIMSTYADRQVLAVKERDTLVILRHNFGGSFRKNRKFGLSEGTTLIDLSVEPDPECDDDECEDDGLETDG